MSGKGLGRVRRMELIAPCHFGLESVLKREIYDLGYDVVKVEDGRVFFEGDEEAVCRANVFLRTAQRILWKVAEFSAVTYDELFEETRAVPWEEFLPENARFWVTKATTVKSRLFSPSDIQSIVKKAMVERMKSHYHTQWFPEDGSAYPVRVFFYKDRAELTLETSGESLHRRGYRKLASKAPITETLAAALLMLTPWNRERILVDPFCGSGTFPIEAAMMAAGIAPGMNRSFQAQAWDNLVSPRLWREAVEEAREQIDWKAETDIQGYDADGAIVKAARENARAAGVDHLIHFQQREVAKLSHPKKYGFLVTNPPYGERLEEKEALPQLYRQIGEAYARLDSWSMYLITAYEHAVRDMGLKPDKNRKIYNGMMKTYFYQFVGPKPPRRKQHGE